MSEDFEVLSAVLDGDTVDIGQLQSALENPAGRRVLLDFVRLRQTAANDNMTPRREFYDRVPGALTLNRRAQTRSLPFPVAAAAILLAMLLGSLVNLNFIRQDGEPSAPPEPARVLKFEPGVDWQP
jgi:hypothetical protein